MWAALHTLRSWTAQRFLASLQGRSPLTQEPMVEINVGWAALELFVLDGDKHEGTALCPGLLRRLQDACEMPDCRVALRRRLEGERARYLEEERQAAEDVEASKLEDRRIWQEAEAHTAWCAEQDGMADEALRELATHLAEVAKW
ncbi:hypothetical protein JHW43_001173 [Diplocarpon mali]|nr:hypothetical protein JHW43_001173 [Diplocarpon mali]